MIRSILVPLDGSDFSAQAIPHAVSVARTCGATVTLVQVHLPVYPAMSLEGVAAFDAQLERDFEEQEENYLAQLAAKFAQESGVAVSHNLVHGEVIGTLVEYARMTHADLFVMTTHGRGGFTRAWLGSVADRLIRASAVPVLLSRPVRGAAASVSMQPFDHVLVPLDCSTRAESVLPFALELGGSRALYTLLRVRESIGLSRFGHYAVTVLGDLEAEDAADSRALAYLDRIATPLREHTARIHTAVRSGASPALDILDYANQYKVDLIALSTHGRHGLTRLALGSVADQLLREFAGFVLVYHPVNTSTEMSDAWSAAHGNAVNENGHNAGIQ